jgi:hypothetical protein
VQRRAAPGARGGSLVGRGRRPRCRLRVEGHGANGYQVLPAALRLTAGRLLWRPRGLRRSGCCATGSGAQTPT